MDKEDIHPLNPIMKELLRITVILIASVLLIFSSCKKDDTKVSPAQITGSFYAFELEMNGETVEPSADEKVEVKISSTDKKNFSLVVIYHKKDGTQTIPAINCKLEHDADGYTILVDQESNNMIVLYYDKDTIDCYFTQGSYLSASRDGKKPKWWD